MKCKSLGANLLKADSQRRIKFGGNPEITDLFLDRIESESKEGKIPPEGDMIIFHYHDKYHHLDSMYTINRDGEVKGLKGEVMKYLFYPNKRGPRVRIQIKRLDKDGKLVSSEKEILILKEMEEKFGIYFPGYKLKQKEPKNYILVPKDGNYENMKYDNLYYLHKNEYYRPKKQLIIEYLSRQNGVIDYDRVAKKFEVSPKYVKEIYQCSILSKKEFYLAIKEAGINISFDTIPIYQALYECEGQLSNLEIAKILRSKELSDPKNQKTFTNKIVRARKNLTDKGLIPRFNGKFESVRDDVIKMIKEKEKTGKTYKEIADVFGIKVDQVIYLARQLKKGNGEE